jgi:hypothetical protein
LVLFVGNCLQVVRVDAKPVAANVVDLLAAVQVTVDQSENCAMYRDHLALVVDTAVTAASARTAVAFLPEPTPRLRILDDIAFDLFEQLVAPT